MNLKSMFSRSAKGHQETPDTTFTIILSEGEDGFVIAECPQLPGCMSQGKTREEARQNIIDAMKSVLVVRIEQLIAQGPSNHSHHKGANEESFRFEPELISV
jgi:predicted RNase H-like HicB family nuclease